MFFCFYQDNVYLRYGRLVQLELQSVSPMVGQDPKRFFFFFLKVYSESEAPLVTEGDV